MSDEKNSQWKSAYQGARWLRVDLHLHSPCVRTFRLSSGMDPERDKPQIVERYVRQLADQNIQIAAITDYQGIGPEWFLPIRDEAQKRGIVIFPGAELSFEGPKHGLHVLAIFPLTADPDAIDRAIYAMDRNPSTSLVRQDGSHRDIDPREDIKDAVRKFREDTKALIILPHPNDENGLFKSYRAQDAAEFLREVKPDAVEFFSEDDKHWLLSTGVLSKGDLQRIAPVAFSDPKAIEDIGSTSLPDGTRRATYLKLSVTNDLNALRLAFHDPEILVRTGEEPAIAHTHFSGLEVDGGGFLNGLSLTFSPELNVLVGGRGVGKSAILETLRYVLDLPPYAPTEYRESLVHYALGSGGKATLYVEQVVSPTVRRRYRFERAWGEEPRVFELNPEREVHLLPLEVLEDQERPLFFGQREIHEVTHDERRRLRLLDEIVGRQAQAQITQVQKLETRLRENARRILERRERLLEGEEVEQRLREIRHDIALYERRGLAEKLQEATALAADEQQLTRAEATVREAIAEWREVGEYWITRWKDVRQQLSPGKSSQRDLLQEAGGILQELQERLEDSIRRGESHLTEAQQQLEKILHGWHKAREPLDEKIRPVKQELGDQVLDPDRLIRLTEEQGRLEPRLKTLEAIQEEVEQLERERRALLRQLRNARHEVWKLRKDQADNLSDQLQNRVRVDVVYRGQRDEFGESLRNFFGGSGVDRRNIERLASKGNDGYAIAEVARKGPQALEEKFGLTPGRAQQAHAYLTEDEGRLFDLELQAPDDAVRVFLRFNESELPLEKLSAGQQATAMLLLLLVLKERILVVDQPEDDLDNRFIYEDIVRILREQKGQRQLLAATHNANIPVLGHAELITALEATEKQAALATQGAIDLVRVQEFVKNVMEGGEDAFRRRAQKYGWI